MSSPKSQHVKFSKSEVSKDEEIYLELERFVHYLAFQNEDPEDIMLEHDELVGELLMEMAKGLKRYGNLPKDQIKAVIRKMMDNRIYELRYRSYSTHRAAARLTVRLDIQLTTDGTDEAWHESIPDECGSAEDMAISRSNVIETRSRLSPRAQKVFDAIIYGNDRLKVGLWLSSLRANAIFKDPKIRMQTFHVADALFMNNRDVRKSFREIRKAYQEVVNE